MKHASRATARRIAAFAFVCLLVPGMPALAQAPATGKDDGGDWPMVARDYANTRYSPLDDINGSNVGNLRVAFTFSTGVLRGHEAAPIVAGAWRCACSSSAR